MKQDKIIIKNYNHKKGRLDDLFFMYKDHSCSVHLLVGATDNSTCPGMFVLLMWGNDDDIWGWISSQAYWADESQDFSEGSNLLEQEFARQALDDLDLMLAIKKHELKEALDV